MAVIDGNFFIQNRLDTAASHHESFEKLWETKWKIPAEKGLYPFMFGSAHDFSPVVEELTKHRHICEPYDWDDYAGAFFPTAERLVREAELAEINGEREKASEYYLRASAVYRIARFPMPRSSKQKLAWLKGKDVAKKGLRLRNDKFEEVSVPHVYRADDEGRTIPVICQFPEGTSESEPCPVVLILTGLDCYRTDLAIWIDGFQQIGVATIIAEIPGTGDSPALPSDPTSADRLWSSLLDWTDGQKNIDKEKICAWGFSTGGYYAIRMAHTHSDRFAGVVAHGGGCHYMFSKKWLDEVNHLEYPFDLANTLAYKFGYGNDVELFKEEALARFSLLEDGTLSKKSCARLLLVNGVDDEIFPIDDSLLALQQGAPKEARFILNKKHMGEPESFHIILQWIYKLFGIDHDSRTQLATTSISTKY